MEDKKYKVSLVKSHGRVGYGFRYWHPVREAPDGKPLRVHRGLGTKDEVEANKDIKALEDLLSRPDLWSDAGRATAERLYPKVVVEAFYDYLAQPSRDYWAIREKEIALLGPHEGYTRLLLAGTTGAGKTTLERQIIGTRPSERFPAISTAKTTTCDWETVIQDTPFKAIVTFLTRDKARQHIEECIARAVTASMNGATPDEVARKFLVHEEERFRLSYLLGSPRADAAEDEFSEKEDDQPSRSLDPDAISRDERIANENTLQAYLLEVSQLSTLVNTSLCDEIKRELGPVPKDATPEDAAAHKDLSAQTFDERLDDHIRKQDAFVALVEEVLDDVERRFTPLQTVGAISYDATQWPSHWVFETEDRSEFIRTIKRFSDNHSANFGRLLTPLVQGIRIRGPFKPAWCKALPKLVLMDGQGIGHVADVDQHLPTSFTKRFDCADAILLVDSAKQPMQAGSIAVLRSVIESGQESKLIICTTHLDTLDKTVWPTTAAKKSHLMSSLDNAIAAVTSFFGNETRQTLSKLLSARAFYFSELQNELPEKRGFTQSELEKLFAGISSVAKKPVVPKMALTYDAINLAFRMQKALQEFHEPWQGILGLRSVPGSPAEHHTRIRALARRLGLLDEDHYADLEPVASLADRLKRYFRLFVSKPLIWPEDCTEERQALIIEKMTAAAKPKLEELASSSIFTKRKIDWKMAYERQAGPKPARLRAQRIHNIYATFAPIPGEEPGLDANALLAQIRQIAKEAIEESGGTLLN
jgi:predicted GTPase